MHGEPTKRGVPGDLAVALAFAVLGSAAFRLGFQDRMLGDGAGLATFYARGDLLAYHFLYLPACRLVAPLAALVPEPALLGGADPIEATRWLSAVAAGLGCAFTWLLARELGAGRRGAAFGTLLVAFSPAVVFFGTTVEVHSLHFATVALGAWLTLRLPWRHPAALPLAAALYALAFWGHQLALLLGPGWMVLCQLGRRRVGRPWTTRGLLLGVGPTLLAGALVASLLASVLRFGTPSLAGAEELDILTVFARPPEAHRFGWDGWLRPLAALLPAALLGALAGGIESLVRRGLLLLVGLPTAFLFAWGVAEYGGYTLGHIPFLGVLAAFAWGGGGNRRLVVGAVLVLAQGTAAVWTVRSFDRGWDVHERVDLVRRNVGTGLFARTVDNAPSMEVYLPVTEVDLWAGVLLARDQGLDVAATVQVLLDQARAGVAEYGRVVYDLGCETQLDRGPARKRQAYFGPLAEALQAEFATRRVEHDHWPLLVVEAP